MMRQLPRSFRRLAPLFLFALASALLASPGRAQMVMGKDMVGYEDTLGVSPSQSPQFYAVHVTACSAPGNVLWPKDAPSFTFQIVNTSGQAIQTPAHVDIIAYGTRGAPGDVWTPHMFKIADVGSVPFAANIAARGFQDVSIAPKIPARLGAYALVVDLGPSGRQFLTTCVRTFPVSARKIQYPHFCLDRLPLPVLTRLGVHAIRYEIGYKPTTDPDFPQWYADQGKLLKAYQDANVTVLFMIGGGAVTGPTQPLGVARPWLTDQGVMENSKFDAAWLPSYDPDFQAFCHQFARDYGWPKGPITSFMLWNEPWEGVSISGWGADMLRYREIYTRLFDGVDQARREDGADVLVGGCDSTSNALDKLFADGKTTFLPMFDFLSIHYQGLASSANDKLWLDRKGPRGRVNVWDTESWVANTDDRVAAVVGGDRAAGYDRAMGVFHGNICDQQDYPMLQSDGTTKPVQTVNAWSVAASIGAATHFIGERPFEKFLFQNGLPWVMVFGGERGNAEDGTVVVVGDLGEEFGADNLPFRTARGFAEIRRKSELNAQLAALPPDAPAATRQQLQTTIDTPQTLSNADMTMPANPSYSLYDFYGNPLPAQNGRITVPLDGRGFFLRGGGKPGDFGRLLGAIRASRITGIEPLAIVAHDLTEPIETHPALRLSLTNVLNAPVTGALSVKLGALTLARPMRHVSIGPNQTLNVEVPVTGGTASTVNTYPLSVTFDAGAKGIERHQEDLHVDYIARRTITVDGNLDDWKGVLPQTIQATGSGAPTLTEKAWLPFQKFDTSVKSGFATGYLACDAKNFYFAAKVADSTPDPGTLRFATRDDDAFFYPAVSYLPGSGAAYSIRWTGRIQPKYSEPYTFTTLSSGGIHLTVDGKLLVNDWASHGPMEDAGSTALVAGKLYEISAEYTHQSGAGAVQLFWQSPSQPREIVPQSAFFSGAAYGLTGRYYSGPDFSQARLTRTDPALDFTWPAGTFPDPAYMKGSESTELDWPAGVRRYTYRKNAELPSGNAPNHDNIQIAFNVLPEAMKTTLPATPGTMPGYVTYQDTDYEYALNQVAPEYGGGTEIWRLAAPGMPHKHFYPRQPKSPLDGPVANGKLVMRREGNTRIVECSIPWTEMPWVKKRIDAGQTVKFSFRVNDNAGGPTMELSKNRSVAKRNPSFHVDWAEHWANELEFGVEK